MLDSLMNVPIGICILGATLLFIAGALRLTLDTHLGKYRRYFDVLIALGAVLAFPLPLQFLYG
ncbi:hypothetical protein MYD40_004627 [Vibrio parahaemolyticus]|nr:hypothetical protein [Vibrio parahaemolyticus]EJC7127665.1 hypothetical protein [Vibrio parahaemolyticus]